MVQRSIWPKDLGCRASVFRTWAHSKGRSSDATMREDAPLEAAKAGLKSFYMAQLAQSSEAYTLAMAKEARPRTRRDF